MKEFLHFVWEQRSQLATQTLAHIGLTFASLLLALLIGVPLGIVIRNRPRLARVVLGLTGILQTVPSIALLGFLIPVLGIGVGPALVALFLYALLPIIRNTYTGLAEVSPMLKEAAFGMGMTQNQVLTRVELPLALPVIFAGIRTATVIGVGVATLAAYVAAGGLGEFIFGGIALNNSAMILAGAIPAAGLAVLFDLGLGWLQRLSRPDFRRAATAFGAVVPFLALVYLVPQWGQTGLRVGFAHEFIGRPDGYPGLVKTYGLRLRPRLIDQNLMYEAIRREQVDLISGYSTDGRIQAFNLRTLTDDHRAFPPYYAALVVRQQTLAQHPELRGILEKLSGKLTDSVMQSLNYQADYQHILPKKVAQKFLKKIGLYKTPTSGARSGRLVMGSKVFTEQYILAEMYRQLIEGYTTLEVATKTGLGGTQICFNALRSGSLDFYPEYTGTGLLVLLQPPQATLDTLLKSPDAVYQFVKTEFARQYDLVWLAPLGFNNTYALMMRENQAQALGIRTISELSRRQ